MDRRDFLRASGAFILGQTLRPWQRLSAVSVALAKTAEQETLLAAIESLANPVAGLSLPLDTSVFFSSARRILDDDPPEQRINYWDYTREDLFADPHYGYFDRDGLFRRYKTRTGFDGKLEHVMAELQGPAVIPYMWFTHTPSFLMSQAEEKEMTEAGYPPQVWGGIQKMGNIRIYVDSNRFPVLDMPVIEFLEKMPLSWRFEHNGANGTYYPFFCKKFIRVACTRCPKFFGIKGVYLDPAVPVPAFSGIPAAGSPEKDLVDDVVAALEKPLEIPRTYSAQEQILEYQVTVGQPAIIRLDTPGIISGLRFALPSDLPLGSRNGLELSVSYTDSTGFSLPLAAFWGPLDWPNREIYYQTSLLGIMAEGDHDLYYTNFAMPFQGIEIRISNQDVASGQIPVRVSFSLSDSQIIPPLRFQAYYSGWVRKEARSDDFMLLPTGEKRRYIGGILGAKEWVPPPEGDWNCSYAEGNIKLIGPPQMTFTGWEDFFTGGYFPTAFMVPPRPLGGGRIRWFPDWNELAVVGLFHGYNVPVVEAVSVEHGKTADNEAELTMFGTSFYYTEVP
jgi:hypothetical protein